MRNLILIFLLFALNGCSDDNYESCVDSVVKTARTNAAVGAGIRNCRSKFVSSYGVIKDCSATWTGEKFVKGVPENPSNYQMRRISKTTHSVYFPLDFQANEIEILTQKHLDQLQKICPFNIDHIDQSTINLPEGFVLEQPKTFSWEEANGLPPKETGSITEKNVFDQFDANRPPRNKD